MSGRKNLEILKTALRVARDVVDREWQALSPERKKRICENLMKRAEARIKAKERDVKRGPS